LLALAVFGFVKGHFTGVPMLKGELQRALVGSLAAGVAYLIAKFIASLTPALTGKAENPRSWLR